MTLSGQDRKLAVANAAILGLPLRDAAEAEAAGRSLASAATRLAIYGSLGPGRENEHIMTRIGGEWRGGLSIAGVREAKGWGAALGYPGVCWRAGRGEKGVFVFEAANLPAHWAELDAFEGEEYARLYVSLWRDGAPADVAFAYVIRDCSARAIAEMLDLAH